MSRQNLPLYVRRKTKVKGPFPQGQISQSILLGRVRLDDEVSEDKENWTEIRKRPELIPDVLKGDRSDQYVQERIEAAKRWADERRASHIIDMQDDREPESYETLEYRNNRESVYRKVASKRHPISIPQAALVVALVVVAVVLGFKYEPRSRLAPTDSIAQNGTRK